MSIDAFHKVNPIKWICFIKEVIETFQREDIILIDSRKLPNNSLYPFIEKVLQSLKGLLYHINEDKGEIISPIGRIPY